MKRSEFISLEDLEQALHDITNERGLADNVDLIMKDIKTKQASIFGDYAAIESPLNFVGFPITPEPGKEKQ